MTGTKQPEEMVTVNFIDLLREKAIAQSLRFRREWEDALAAKMATVAEAVATKGRVPDNYWQAEHRAKARYGAALLLVELLS